MGAEGQIDAVILLLQLVEGTVGADVHAGMYLDPQREDGGNLLIQQLTRETVAGDAVAHHAAQLALALIYRHLVAHQRQIVGGGQPAGAAAHDGHRFAGSGRAGGLGHVACLIYGVAL